MPTWTVIAHTPISAGYIVGGCVEVAGRLYTVITCPDTRTLGELGIDVQVRCLDGETLEWIDIRTEAFMVMKITTAPPSDTGTLIVTVNANGTFVAQATVVPNRPKIGEIQPASQSAGITGRLRV